MWDNVGAKKLCLLLWRSWATRFIILLGLSWHFCLHDSAARSQQAEHGFHLMSLSYEQRLHI